MRLEIVALPLGLLQTNAYLIADAESGEAAVIDPGGEGKVLLKEASRRGWRVAHIWLTHAHFDHLGGSAELADGLEVPPTVALHPLDYPLWRMQGGAPMFGMKIDPGPEPNMDLEHGQVLRLGSAELVVLHTPGHTRGSVTFYCKAAEAAFVGDLIFQGSIGRTDLSGGDFDVEIQSIREHILTLPDETRLLPGHGLETTVRLERQYNPFLQEH